MHTFRVESELKEYEIKMGKRINQISLYNLTYDFDEAKEKIKSQQVEIDELKAQMREMMKIVKNKD
jgi:hypothetical protein